MTPAQEYSPEMIFAIRVIRYLVDMTGPVTIPGPVLRGTIEDLVIEPDKAADELRLSIRPKLKEVKP